MRLTAVGRKHKEIVDRSVVAVPEFVGSAIMPWTWGMARLIEVAEQSQRAFGKTAC